MWQGVGQAAYHLAWHDVPLKGLGLVKSPGEAIHQEAVAAALDHGIPQQSNGHLHETNLVCRVAQWL